MIESFFAVLIIVVFILITVSAVTPQTTLSKADVPHTTLIIHALPVAFPGRIQKVTEEGTDWKIILDGDTFFWADGRLLPEKDLTDINKYSRHPFYSYTRELRPIPQYTDEEKKGLNERIANRKNDPPKRNPAFHNALWRVYDKKSADETMKWISFLNYTVQIHPGIESSLDSVETEIRQKAEHNPELKKYISSFTRISGYTWRPIADTKSLSFHSYGVAIDIIPGDTGGKEQYWLWTARSNAEWFQVPYSRRYSPPAEFIEAFEHHGFIWGGKWFYFDTIHFEYRPEILIANGMRPEKILPQ